MTVPARIHILGASGAGTSTLGREIAARYGHGHLDTDDFYWLPSDPPYQTARPRIERLNLLRAALDTSPRWALSGSLCGWGDEVISRFNVVIFVTAPTEARLERLRAREAARFGAAILPGGRQHAQHITFLAWAATYDRAGPDSRSRALHESWLAALPCPVRHFENAGDIHALGGFIESIG